MFCRTVRYSLSGSTVFLAGRYGKACRRVRYVLLGSTVKLVGGYGIALQASVREPGDAGGHGEAARVRGARAVGAAAPFRAPDRRPGNAGGSPERRPGPGQ